MFERFTDRARRVVVLAQDEARLLNHDYIGTEHLLLGLIHEGKGVAAQVLEALGISLATVRQQVEDIIGTGQEPPSGHIPFTPRAKKVLELSLREALQLGHDYIGTEHILLGLLREGDGVAAQVLVSLGADLNVVRERVSGVLRGRTAESQLQQSVLRIAAASQLDEVLSTLRAIDGRLAAIERHLGIVPEAPPSDGPPSEGPPGDGAAGENPPEEA
jgi:ATP-dependent Clp protease ATP-binding subunit ClpC